MSAPTPATDFKAWLRRFDEARSEAGQRAWQGRARRLGLPGSEQYPDPDAQETTR